MGHTTLGTEVSVRQRVQQSTTDGYSVLGERMDEMVPRYRKNGLRCLSLTILVCSMTLMAGCTDIEEVESTAREPVAASGLAPMSIEELFYSAGAVIQAEVIDVRGPIWNSPDGMAWSELDYEDSYANPFQYREVDLRVLVSHRDELSLGDKVTIVARGNGEPALSDTGEIGGRFVVGEQVVVALTRAFFMMRDGPVDRVYALDGAGGVFDVLGDELVRQVEDERLAIADLESEIGASRDVVRPEWDDTRYPPTAEEQLQAIKEAVERIEAENRETVNDPNNICHAMGDKEKSEQWLRDNPERTDVNLEKMLDPHYVDAVCDGFESTKGPGE